MRRPWEDVPDRFLTGLVVKNLRFGDTPPEDFSTVTIQGFGSMCHRLHWLGTMV